MEAFRPPDTNVIPEENNGVRGDGSGVDGALEQVKHLLLEGEVEHFCDGPCDPD